MGKKAWPSLILTWIILSWSASSLQASNISFEITHNYTIEVFLVSDPANSFPTMATASFFVIDGKANYNPDEEIVKYGNSPQSYSGGVWLNTMLSEKDGGNHLNMVGTGPNKSSSWDPGKINQYGQIETGYNILGPTGDYQVNIHDSYSYRYRLINGDGNKFYQVSWHAAIGNNNDIVNISFGNDPLRPLSDIDSGWISGERNYSIKVTKHASYETTFTFFDSLEQDGLTKVTKTIIPQVHLLLFND